MTYVELVNAVLVRLREDTVTSVSQTDYSRLVGAFVNDAKRVVEDAWPWSALLRTASIPVTSGVVGSYDLEDYTGAPDSVQFNERARLYREPSTNKTMVYVTTNNYERYLNVIPQSAYKIKRQSDQNDSVSGRITDIIVGTNPTATSGKSRLRFTTNPVASAANETIQIYIINPQNALTADSEVLLVPSDPVIQLAYLYCLYERGEELGEMLTLTSNKAEAALADAIMLDSSMTSEVVFTSP